MNSQVTPVCAHRHNLELRTDCLNYVRPCLRWALCLEWVVFKWSLFFFFGASPLQITTLVLNDLIMYVWSCLQFIQLNAEVIQQKDFCNPDSV